MLRYLGTWRCAVQDGCVLLPQKLNTGNETLYCRKIMVDGKSGMAAAPAVGAVMDAATGPVHTAELCGGRLVIPGEFLPQLAEQVYVLGCGEHMEIFFDGFPAELPETWSADLHMHPLDHCYYGGQSDLSGIVLHERDKQAVREVVDWCVQMRKLDIIALTDHDMIQASLYARDYVHELGLPVKIVTGAECEVIDPKDNAPMQLVHLLCLNLPALPHYSWQTTVPEMIRMVKGMGGTVIMSHPIYYPASFARYAHLLDGYEYRNGRNQPFEEGKELVRRYSLAAQPFANSDFHYSGSVVSAASDRLQQNRLTGKQLPMLGLSAQAMCSSLL